MLPREQMVKFFKALDDLLSSEVELTVIGGTAMVLGYGSSRMTMDCDPWGRAQDELLKHWEKARKVSGVDISIDTQAGVAQLPEGAEDRFETLGENFKNLKIQFPEKHDLALSKLARLQGSDLDDIVFLHKSYTLDKETLLERYKEEFRPSYIGQVKFLDLNFLDVIEELFGDQDRQKFEVLLR